MAERLISQLAHVEVLTPTPDESLRFYTDVLGLEESGREGAVGLPARLGGALPPLAAADGGRGSRGSGISPGAPTGPSSSSRPSHASRRRASARAGATARPGRARPSATAARRAPARALLGGRALRGTARARVAVPEPPAALRPPGIAARQIDHVTVATADPGADAAGTARRSVTGSWSTPSSPTGRTGSSSR